MFAGNESKEVLQGKAPTDPMAHNWIGAVLSNLKSVDLDEQTLRKIIKTASSAHYNQLNMEETLKPYRGKLNDFIAYIEKEWGWTCNYEENGNVLQANENKPYCVCPLIDQSKKEHYPALCFCSEGFAEQMFSTVCGHNVQATVISSIQRNDKRCIYRIDLNPPNSI
jgi:hypothetical protein